MKKVLFSLIFLFININCFESSLHEEFKNAICSKDLGRVKTLLKSGAKPSYAFSDGITSFMIAVRNSSREIVYELLNDEPLVMVKDSILDIPFVKDINDRNAFWYSCVNSDSSILQLLLDYCDKCSSDEKTIRNLLKQSDKYSGGTTALMIACFKNNFKHVQIIISYLVKNKINIKEYINLKDKKGRTALHFAAENGNVDMATILLAFGANINAIDNNRQTALHYAAKASKVSGGATNADYQQLAGFFIKNKINQSIVDKDGKTALDLYK